MVRVKGHGIEGKRGEKRENMRKEGKKRGKERKAGSAGHIEKKEVRRCIIIRGIICKI